jgi:hypothetical protein
VPHWKSMMQKDYLYAFDLKGRDQVVTIERIQAGTLKNGQKTTKKPLCFFSGIKRPLALNATNCKTIAAMFGNDTDDWRGKRITLYPTMTQFGGADVECIRVRPRAPDERAAPGQISPEPEPQETDSDEEREPGSDDT